MRLLAGACVALLVGGCASSGRIAAPDQEVSSGAGIQEAACSDCAASVNAECSRAAYLADVGEHKPAVDVLEALLARGATCPQPVLNGVAESRHRLSEADSFVHLGLEARSAGDVAAAGQRFLQALAVYPKYYWVQRLATDLQPSSSEEIVRLEREAARLLSSGRPEAALQMLSEAGALVPAAPELSREIVRIRTELGDSLLGGAHRALRAARLNQAAELTTKAIAARPDYPVRDQVVDFARRLGLRLFAAGELSQARQLWQAALSLDEDNELVRQYLNEVGERLRSLDQIKESSGNGAETPSGSPL